MGRLRQTSAHSSQSLHNEQPGLCVFHIEVAYHECREPAVFFFIPVGGARILGVLKGEPKSFISAKMAFTRQVGSYTFMYQSVVLGQLLRLSRVARFSWGLAKYRVDTKAFALRFYIGCTWASKSHGSLGFGV